MHFIHLHVLEVARQQDAEAVLAPTLVVISHDVDALVGRAHGVVEELCGGHVEVLQFLRECRGQIGVVGAEEAGEHDAVLHLHHVPIDREGQVR